MGTRIVRRGVIVLVRYPFSDLSSTKVRPAVILTPDDLMPKIDDAMCLFISSTIPSELLPTDIVLKKSDSSFVGTGLKFSSVLRAHKLALLHKSLILRAIGEADMILITRINQKLRIALGL